MKVTLTGKLDQKLSMIERKQLRKVHYRSLGHQNTVNNT